MATQNLAIMFTDIKGFTERTSGSTREGMKSLLAEHDRLLVPVFQYFDGRIVKTIGDAFLVTFGSPTDAVLCGVTIQEVLRQYNLAAEEPRRLDVRVAINVGEVEVKDNDVLGEAVNIAARLEGVTEAGEVWFTDAVYQTMNRSEAPSADIGEKLFKGIPHPVRVYRVAHEPGSELATRLANGVRLSERGPVLTGIRETIRKRRVVRNALIGAALVALVVVGVALVLMRPAPVAEPPPVAGPPPVEVDAQAAAVAAAGDPKQQGQYYAKAFKEFLAKHPQDAQAPLVLERALGDAAAAQTRLWLHQQAFERGMAPTPEILAWHLALQADDRDIDWQLLDASRALLAEHYPAEAAEWAGTALAGSGLLAFLNAWALLEASGDTRLQEPHYAALKSLVYASDIAVVEAARTGFLAEQDPARRAQVLGFLDALVGSFPRFLNSGDVRDALVALREELARTADQVSAIGVRSRFIPAGFHRA